MDYYSSYQAIQKNIPSNVKLIAVTKFQPVEVLEQFYKETGHTIFGENRVQECVSKIKSLPASIEWHFIGHLQTNKVDIIVPQVHMIQSGDRFKILQEINREAAKLDKKAGVLLEFHIAREESKYGLSFDQAAELLESSSFTAMNNISIRGVMGMASFVDNPVQVRNEFRSLRNIFEQLRRNYFSNDEQFSELSMGMSGDYRIAIEEGSTMVRIGTLLFSDRSVNASA